MRVLCLLFFLLCSWDSRAQQPFFREIQVDAQNDQLHVTTISQSTNGLLYVGSDHGLFCYDGFDFLPVALPDSIQDKTVTAMASAAGGYFIVALSGGKLLQIKNNRISPIVSPASAIIKTIIETKDGTLWIATYGEGIFFRKNRIWRRLSSLPDPYVYQMVEHPSGKLLAGTDGGLIVIDPSTEPAFLQVYDSRKGLPDNIVKAVGVQPDGRVILGLQELGLFAFDLRKGNFSPVTSFDKWKGGTVNCMTLLQNEFWLGTENGIADFEFRAEKRLRYFDKSNGFPYEKVNAILRDTEGNMWMAADDKLVYSPGEKIEFLNQFGRQQFDSIQAITAADNGVLWFSNPDGLFRYAHGATETGKLKKFELSGKRQMHIVSLHVDAYGFLWVGTFDDGLFRLNPLNGTVRRFTEKDGLPNANVISICSQDNSIWLATLGGIVKCTLPDTASPVSVRNPYVFESFNSDSSSFDGFVYQVFVDRKGVVWFGTDGKGLLAWHKGKFIDYPELKQVKVVYSIVEDAYGNIWFSTAGKGVYRYDGKRFRNFSLTDGLSALDISGLSVDQDGSVIVVNAKGIDVINTSSFRIETMGPESGITTIDADLNALTRDDRGVLWIGARKGLFRFQHSDQNISTYPKLILRGVYTFMKQSVNPRDSVFAYNQNNISFEYTGLWFTHPDLVSYKYRLKGYSNTWIPTRDRIVTFPNLPPGRYTLEVMAGLGGQFKSSSMLTYGFIVKKPIWKENWFLAIIIVVLGGSIVLFVRDRDLRLRRMESMKKERVEYQFATLKSQVNPHFLFNSFNTLIAIIEEDKEKAVSYVEKLSDYFRNMVQHREKDLITLGEELEMVATYYFLQQKRFGDNLHLQVEIPENWKSEFGLPPLSLQLLIENAVKHNAVSHETPLTILISAYKDDSLRVVNNINPKRQPEKSTGIGLGNIKSRIQIISGRELKVDDAVDGHFIVELPLIHLKR